jgi:dolichol-phosphate mannosyltransferase
MKKKLVSLICPVLNEQENIETFYREVNAVISELADDYDFEFVFTDNRSTDRTFELLQKVAARDPRVRIFRFAKNYGYQSSIHTGYCKARGDAAIQLDCDLQDPPEMIPEFLGKWEEGFRVVYGIRTARQESWRIQLLRRLFYRLIDLLSHDELPVDVGDFRLIDRAVIDALKDLDPRFLYIRGAIAQMGFDQAGIEYKRRSRSRGESKFGVLDLVRLALDGFLYHSVVPLRFAAYFGFLLSTATTAVACGYVAVRLTIGSNWPAGFTTITIFILLSLGLNSFFLGILGEYLGRIYRQQGGSPGVLIDESLEGPESSSSDESTQAR